MMAIRREEYKPRLQEVREEAGLTRDQVASLVQPPVASKTIERWEKGSTPVTHQRMRQLALLYRVSLPELVKAA